MEPRFNFFNQICITSGNVRAISDLFTDVYGLGPWLYVTFGDDGTHNFISVDDVVLGGVPRSSYSLINGTCRIGNMEYELLQPAGGVSVNSEFLEKRDGRPGLQHFCLDDGAAFDPIRRSLDALGLDREQIACIDHIETCVMRDLKSIIGSDIELHRRDADFRYPDVTPEFYPPSNTMEGRPAPALGDSTKITYVVADMEAVLRMFREGLQLCDWSVAETVYGAGGGEYPVRRAVCGQRNLAIELLQPLSGDGLLADFLRDYGPSAFSVGIKPLLEDGELRARMEQAGYGRRETLTLDGETRTLCDHLGLIGLYFELV